MPGRPQRKGRLDETGRRRVLQRKQLVQGPGCVREDKAPGEWGAVSLGWDLGREMAGGLMETRSVRFF